MLIMKKEKERNHRLTNFEHSRQKSVKCQRKLLQMIK